jgi:hypothetical protein
MDGWDEEAEKWFARKAAEADRSSTTLKQAA